MQQMQQLRPASTTGTNGTRTGGHSADLSLIAETPKGADDAAENECRGPSSLMRLDKLTAYHFGPRFLVELEMVMPENTLLRDSHDAGIELQHQIEKLPAVERCFVHIDYSSRVGLVDDHDPAAPLYLKTYTGSPAFAEHLTRKVENARSREQSATDATEAGGGGAGGQSDAQYPEKEKSATLYRDLGIGPRPNLEVIAPPPIPPAPANGYTLMEGQHQSTPETNKAADNPAMGSRGFSGSPFPPQPPQLAFHGQRQVVQVFQAGAQAQQALAFQGIQGIEKGRGSHQHGLPVATATSAAAGASTGYLPPQHEARDSPTRPKASTHDRVHRTISNF